ncbi:MAG: dicarboxylate/amino acid:cation symporter [Pseudomonadota bacterium]
MGWTKITLWKRVVAGLLLGLLAGLALRYGLGSVETADGVSWRAADIANTWLKPFGDGFVRLIKMLVVPLIFTTLVSGILAMGDPGRLGGLGAKTIGMYLGTTFLAVSFGLIMGTLLQPGVGVDVGGANSSSESAVMQRLDTAAAADTGIAGKILAVIPENIVIAMADGATGNVLQIIFFAILFGVACLMAGEKGKPVATVIESAAEAMLKMTVLIMELAPIGVFFLMSWVMATQGLGILVSLGKLTIALYAACFLHIIIVQGVIIVRGLLGLPMARFFSGVRDAQSVAFSTASSAGTLPVTIANVTENLGVKKSVAASVLPVGATINMDGTAIYLGIVALFGAQAAGIDVTPGMYIGIALAATLTSIGAAAIPSAGLLLAAAVLSQVGLDATQSLAVIAFIFPFDRLLDMMRTVVNVTGDAAVASAVAKWEGELDEDVFREKATL